MTVIGRLQLADQRDGMLAGARHHELSMRIDTSNELSWLQLAWRLRGYYKANDINVSKLLHGFRVLGACTLDDAGVPDEVRLVIVASLRACRCCLGLASDWECDASSEVLLCAVGRRKFSPCRLSVAKFQGKGCLPDGW